MYAGGFGNKILTDCGFLISGRIPHSVCLKVGNVDHIAIWSGSLGMLVFFRVNFSKFSAPEKPEMIIKRVKSKCLRRRNRYEHTCRLSFCSQFISRKVLRVFKCNKDLNENEAGSADLTLPTIVMMVAEFTYPCWPPVDPPVFPPVGPPLTLSDLDAVILKTIQLISFGRIKIAVSRMELRFVWGQFSRGYFPLHNLG